eukprot:GEMP01040494.1.p1 GENE.GEMP01040494.1~~GEMP01040494.1.p1  ORF type:complete len:237 (-),score=50.12 GEMP01040494.1:1185-1823(-)
MIWISIALVGAFHGQIFLPTKFKMFSLESTTLILHGGAALEPLRLSPLADGRFEFPEVSEGSYFLQISHPTLTFDPLQVDVTADKKNTGKQKISAYLIDAQHRKGPKLKYPLGLAPSEKAVYFEERESFSILSVLSNPMALIMGVSVLLMVVMPKLQPELSADEQSEMKKQLGDGVLAASFLRTVTGATEDDKKPAAISGDSQPSKGSKKKR